jgi:hypothetical protein
MLVVCLAHDFVYFTILNIANVGIKKAEEWISFENLTPKERTESKNKETSLVTIPKIGKNARDDERAKAEKKPFWLKIGRRAAT